MNTAMLRYYNAEIFSEIDEINTNNKENSSRSFKVGEIGEHGFSNFPENWQNYWAGSGRWRKPDVPTTDPENKKETHLVF